MPSTYGKARQNYLVKLLTLNLLGPPDTLKGPSTSFFGSVGHFGDIL